MKSGKIVETVVTVPKTGRVGMTWDVVMKGDHWNVRRGRKCQTEAVMRELMKDFGRVWRCLFWQV
jgi:hypothetical protein